MKNEQVKSIALSNGFKLKEQPGGEMDLNPYVYDFAETLLSDLQKQNDELRRQLTIRDELLCKTCKGAGTVLIAPDDGIECPECAQSLSDIRAEAVDSVMKNCKIEPMFGSDIMGTISVMEIVEYANRIKEGK